MAKFILAYHGGNGMPEDKDQQAKLYAAWGAWFGQLGAAVVDGGNPVAQTYTVLPGGEVVTHGGANPITGYSLISADDIDAAVKLAQSCPVLANGGSVEVAQAVEM